MSSKNWEEDWEKARKGICPICNTKSLVEHKNFVTCTHCEGTPMVCSDRFVTSVVDPQPEKIDFCPRCGEEAIPSTGHILFLVRIES